MNFLDRMAEAQIRTAAANGAFDDLPGAGRPLPADEALHVPAQLRPAYRVLKNAGYIPPEIVRAQDIHHLRDLLTRVQADSAEARAATRRLRWLEASLASSKRGRGLLTDSRYGRRLKNHLSGAK